MRNKSIYLPSLMLFLIAFVVPRILFALPPGFIEETISSGFTQAVGMTFLPDERMIVWEKDGRVFLVDKSGQTKHLMLDISLQVYNKHDHGLLGLAVHPDFENGSPYIYLLYAVDYAYLIAYENQNGLTYPMGTPDQTADTIGRLTKHVVLNPSSAAPTIHPTPLNTFIGNWQTLRDAQGNLTPPHITDGFPLTNGSHGPDTLAFGSDKTLLVSAGDGASWSGMDTGGTRTGVTNNQAEILGILRPEEQVGAFRAQLKNSLSGKILRLDPTSGRGPPSNPFYNPSAPFSAQSRLYSFGLRNPYRFSVKPGTGSPNILNGNPGVLYVGDVGWNTWEEINIVTQPAMNFGWPLFEGMSPQSSYQGSAVTNLNAPNLEVPCALTHYPFRNLLAQQSLNPLSFPHPCDANVQIPSAFTFMHRRPVLAWNHSTALTQVGYYDAQGNAVALSITDPASPVTGPNFNGFSSLGGAWYMGDKFPEPYRNRYYFSDSFAGWIQTLEVDAHENPVAVSTFDGPTGRIPVHMTVDPNGYGLYYTDYGFSPGLAKIKRISYDCNGNGLGDDKDILEHRSFDCDLNGIPDECQSEGGVAAVAAWEGNLSNPTYRFAVTTDPYTGSQTIRVVKKKLSSYQNVSAISYLSQTASGSTSSFSLLGSLTADVRVLAKEITYGAGGPDVPVTADYATQSGSLLPIFGGLPVAVGQEENIGIETGALTFRGNSAYPDFSNPTFSFSALSSSLNALILQNNDDYQTLMALRHIPQQPFGPQLKAACFLAPYINLQTQRVHLPDNHLLILFELGTTSSSSAAYDFQDLILLVSPN